MGRDAGLTEAKLVELDRYATSAAFTRVERLALRLTDAMCDTPAHVDDALFAELRAALTEPQLVELASAIAWENYRARFNRVFDVESEDFSAGAFCPLPLRGLV